MATTEKSVTYECKSCGAKVEKEKKCEEKAPECCGKAMEEKKSGCGCGCKK